MADRISAIVVCFNEEEHIRACLQSVSWCDEIVVVDSRSTDRTREIAREFTDRLYVRNWPGYREQKQFALEQATGEWVLNVDADERVSVELRAEICRLLSTGTASADGYFVPRVVHYLGRWWFRGGWYPDYRLRFFRRERAVWGGTNPHEKVVVRGRTQRLAGHLLHYTYADIADHLETVNRLTDISAQEIARARQRVRLSEVGLRPAWRFLRSLTFDRGVLEGWAGYFVAATAAFYVYLKYAKAREFCGDPPRGHGSGVGVTGSPGRP